jgi:exopolysaccharide biosynthesis polyprenyl glycosylphosphotransferase
VVAEVGPEVVAQAWLSLLTSTQHCSTSRVLYYSVVKRGIDVVVASLTLLVFLPLMVLVAFAVALDSRGPVLFRQTRVGQGGRPFTVYKFRTMTHAPGEELRRFQGADGKWRHKVKHDPRVTRVGRYIRRSSIDELPQLLNVVRGEMSLIGPRPELPQIVEQYGDWQHQRHLVRPGLTGWWQIQGRSDQPMHENTHLDLYYVENLSWRLDLQILRRTVRVVLGGLGAF